MSHVTRIQCSACGSAYEAGKIHNLCTACGGPLLVRYDLGAIRNEWSREELAGAPNSMWRYGAVLPVQNPANIGSLGEGMTPLVRTARLGSKLIAHDLWV